MILQVQYQKIGNLNFIEQILLDTFWSGGSLLVAQCFETLRYKPEGRGFDSRLCHWILSLT
jgi:hypothetical protein